MRETPTLENKGAVITPILKLLKGFTVCLPVIRELSLGTHHEIVFKQFIILIFAGNNRAMDDQEQV